MKEFVFVVCVSVRANSYRRPDHKLPENDKKGSSWPGRRYEMQGESPARNQTTSN